MATRPVALLRPQGLEIELRGFGASGYFVKLDVSNLLVNNGGWTLIIG